jgi:hypothetical protein
MTDVEKKPFGVPFEPGRAKTGGRVRGVKNRLSHDFLTALADDFEQHGAEAIRICRVEKPNEYVRTIAHLMPRELEINDNRLQEISDDDLFAYIEYVNRQLAGRVVNLEGRRVEETNGEPVELLQALPGPKEVS